jgi:hypothetical protein
MKIPDIDLEELKKKHEENFRERLEFIKKYAHWIKTKKWVKSKKPTS